MAKKMLKKAQVGRTVKPEKTWVDMFGVTHKGVKPKPTTFKKGGTKKK